MRDLIRENGFIKFFYFSSVSTRFKRNIWDEVGFPWTPMISVNKNRLTKVLRYIYSYYLKLGMPSEI